MKRKPLDWIVLSVVIVIAGVVVMLSFHNTATLARGLNLNPYLTAGLVEILFTSLLFIRGRQRATQRNVPRFLTAGYFTSLAFVTGVNMYGLYQAHAIVGPIVGLAISSAMWLMESSLVWLWTEAHKPHKKSLREIRREARREIKEEKLIQWIEWERWEARKPDLDLIRAAREAEEERKRVVGDGLPEYFTREPVKEIAAEPVTTVQEPEPETEPKHTAEVVPMRQIGFRMEPSPKTAPRFQPNLEARAKAIQKAEELMEELGRIPRKRELMEQGLTEHYAKVAIGELKSRETQ
ncbi:hypothetical protein [Lihuaxuella thermophila]|uniref:DUF2637 domain-containing protein n=1 Tax=Lihuaxuella thermophila TaxID=1173111 RepID=A0A1H8JCH4_9BACL|nr:hypothetical protein [Lihuaxuella thermophila]SEN77838.1 hypothetical protein SAMN05444955_12318 [Lihuaxuella thermophila]